MLLRQVLQFVVIEVATQADRREHHDRPVSQAGTTVVGTAAGIHILADYLENLPPQRHLPVHMLQGSQNRDDLIPTIEVQRHGIDGRAIQSRLFLKGQTHRNPP